MRLLKPTTSAVLVVSAAFLIASCSSSGTDTNRIALDPLSSSSLSSSTEGSPSRATTLAETNAPDGAGEIPEAAQQELASADYSIVAADASDKSSITAAEAVEASRQFISGKLDGTAYLRRCTTPTHGKLENLDDPSNSGVIPTFDDDLCYVVIFNTETSGSNSFSGQGADRSGAAKDLDPGYTDSDEVIPGLAVAFVDATTGKGEFAVVF